ncbi:hypothetical protein BJP39_05575 [Streptomyces sp. CC77]|nr:hypothetical protein BJP39_05575 [Streptomyces sp. CC77]
MNRRPGHTSKWLTRHVSDGMARRRFTAVPSPAMYQRLPLGTPAAGRTPGSIATHRSPVVRCQRARPPHCRQIIREPDRGAGTRALTRAGAAPPERAADDARSAAAVTGSRSPSRTGSRSSGAPVPVLAHSAHIGIANTALHSAPGASHTAQHRAGAGAAAAVAAALVIVVTVHLRTRVDQRWVVTTDTDSHH